MSYSGLTPAKRTQAEARQDRVKTVLWIPGTHGTGAPAILSKENYEVARFSRIEDRDAVLVAIKGLAPLLAFAEQVSRLQPYRIGREGDVTPTGGGDDAMEAINSLIDLAQASIRKAVTGA